MALNRSQEMIERDIKKKRNKNNDKKILSFIKIVISNKLFKLIILLIYIYYLYLETVFKKL